MSSLRRGWLAAVAALFLFAGASDAQQVFGRIFGTVTDASGGAVSNAKVTVTDQAKGTSSDVPTNESGNYEKGQLTPGKYTIEVEAAGFGKQSFKDISVSVDNAARVDAALQAGNVTTTVEVTAAAPTLQADRADVQTTFSSKQLIELPSIGRNAQAYELLTPGAQRIGFNHASSEDPQGSLQINVNGQHFSSTGYILDGTTNQDPILGIVVINSNLDSIAEQKMAAQNYDAEFGYVAAGTLNVSTKSGSNDLHFTAFEYLRNNSPGFTTFGRDPFAEPNGAPPYKQNIFGGSVGGRIIKDKLFWFGDAELNRLRQTGAVQTTVLTQLARQGNFSEYLGAPVDNGATTVLDTAGNRIPLRANQIFDPTSGNPATGQARLAFANNTIPVTRLSPQAQNLLNRYLPLPNRSVANPLLPNYTASGTDNFDANKWDARGDYYLNEKTSFFGRYSNHQFQRATVGAFGFAAGGPAFNGVNFAGNSFVRNQSISIGTTHSFSPTVINEFRFGYVKYNVQTTPNGVGTQPATDAGIPGLNGLNGDNFYTSGLPYFNLGLTSLGYSLGANQCNCPLTENEGQYQVVDNLTKIQGNHSFKFGADIRYAKNLRVPSDSHRAGELVFAAGRTGYVAPGATSTQQGLDFATFALGDVTGFSRYVSSSTNAAEHQRRWFFYGQDSWRATSKLTINYGLRWELIFPERVNGAGNGAQLDLRTGLINVFGIGNVSNHGVQDMNYQNFAPRVGIAYQITPKTVIRAGYGWSYGLGVFGATFGHNVTQQPPVLSIQQNNAPNSFQSVFTLAQGAPAPAPITVPNSGQFILPDKISAKARPLDVRLPRTEAYNLTVERQIANGTSVSVGYVGNVGRHVPAGSGDGFNFNVNQPGFIPGFTGTLDQRRPFYNFIGANGLPLRWTQGIDFYCQCFTNRYNSLQAQLKRQVGSYGVQVSYTFQDATGDGTDSYTLLYNRPLGRGRESAIADHILTVAQNWSIPFGRKRRFGANMNRFVDYVLGGWDLAGVTTFYSGLPFTPTIQNFASTDIRPDVGPGTRPNRGTGDPYAANQSRDGWLNIGAGGALSSAYAVPANNTFGNFGINTLRGPIYINQDLNVSKNFSLTERLVYTIRGEAYNLFNHTNLGLPNTNVNGNNPGVITGLAYPGQNMRRLQFAMRLQF